MYTQFASAELAGRHLLDDPDSSAASLAARIYEGIAGGSLEYRAG